MYGSGMREWPGDEASPSHVRREDLHIHLYMYMYMYILYACTHVHIIQALITCIYVHAVCTGPSPTTATDFRAEGSDSDVRD